MIFCMDSQAARVERVNPIISLSQTGARESPVRHTVALAGEPGTVCVVIPVRTSGRPAGGPISHRRHPSSPLPLNASPTSPAHQSGIAVAVAADACMVTGSDYTRRRRRPLGKGREGCGPPIRSPLPSGKGDDGRRKASDVVVVCRRRPFEFDFWSLTGDWPACTDDDVGRSLRSQPRGRRAGPSATKATSLSYGGRR